MLDEGITETMNSIVAESSNVLYGRRCIGKTLCGKSIKWREKRKKNDVIRQRFFVAGQNSILKEQRNERPRSFFTHLF